jgi:peptidoglycan/LPS O-acetylase OafA/YrhL
MREKYYNMYIVRYFLAFGVFIAHYNILCSHDLYYPITAFDRIGGFFAMSGFLIYPSWQKRGTLAYMKNRAKKIIPPYLFIVIACALLLSLISTLSFKEYFSSSQLYKYIVYNACFVNWFEPSLPGVFEGDNYYISAVNGALWTMKVEWILCFSIPIFAWFCNKFKLNKKIVAAAIIVLSIIYRLVFVYLFDVTGKEIYDILGRQFCGQMCYFYIGLLLYFYLDFFKKHIKKFFFLGLVLYAIGHINYYLQVVIHPISITSVIMAMSLYPKDIKILRHKNNLSYNIYLFHYPLLQLSVFFGISTYAPYISFTVVALAAVLLAYVVKRILD